MQSCSLHARCIGTKQPACLLKQMLPNVSCFAALRIILYFYRHSLRFQQHTLITVTRTVCCCFLYLTYSSSFSRLWTYHPMIRPILPSPPKHDGARHAVVTQSDFFFLPLLNSNTFPLAQTKAHRDRRDDYGTR